MMELVFLAGVCTGIFFTGSMCIILMMLATATKAFSFAARGGGSPRAVFSGGLGTGEDNASPAVAAPPGATGEAPPKNPPATKTRMLP